MTKKHRAFNYIEKKINRMTRADLQKHLFNAKIDPDRLRYALHKEEGMMISIRKAKLLKWRLEEQFNMENRDVAKAFMEVIYDLKEVFHEFALSECLAISMKYIDSLEPNSDKPKLQVYKEAIEGHILDWETSMMNL